MKFDINENSNYISVASLSSTVITVPYTIPQAEYMYGCTATVVGMLLGYYDRWGYCGYDVSNLIQGTVELNARGTDGNMYDMDAFDTVLGNAIASREYVERFYGKTPSEELPYTFVNGEMILNTEEWNCIADYLGTGQFWRKNSDLSTRMYFTSLENISSSSQTTSITSDDITVTIPIKFIDFVYGLSLYVENAGYLLDEQNSRTVSIDADGGSFTFEDYCAEIDAGRLVILHITSHSMLGYGYNKETREVIFDDTYKHDQRMEWGGNYSYSGAERTLHSVTTIRFDESVLDGIPEKPDAPEFEVDIDKWTNLNVTVTADYDPNSDHNEFSYDGKVWQEYTKALLISENKKIYFRSTDIYGKISDVTVCNINYIDKIPPVINVSGNVSQWTAEDVILTVSGSDDLSGIYRMQYSYDGSLWENCSGTLTVDENKTVYFRVIDYAGNISEITEIIDKIDKDRPEKPQVSANITDLTNQDVLVRALFSDDSFVKEYSYDGINWMTYQTALPFEENGKVYFRSADIAGNYSEIVEYTVKNIDKIAPVITLNTDNETLLRETMLEVFSDDGSAIYYHTGDENWIEYTVPLLIQNNGTFYLRATDAAGNTSFESVMFNNMINSVPENLHGDKNFAAWDSNAEDFIFNIVKKDYENGICFEVKGNGVDFYALPGGNFRYMVRSASGTEWSEGIDIKSDTGHIKPKMFCSDANGVHDVFFVNPHENWTAAYNVCHVGIKDVWEGTGETFNLVDKLCIKDIFEGSSDSNTLILTDYKSGDVLCLDDVFSASAANEQCSRISRINEIFAGAGDDIVDLTSQKFEYDNDIIIHGGEGDDIIWANCGRNKLFGDDGNDRIVGGSADDIISGGAGDDILHGGGGTDIFAFGGDFGNDIVTQLDDGAIILHFAEENGTWDAEKRIYSAGNNSVTVLGNADVELCFGVVSELEVLGAFEEKTSEKIFGDRISIA